MPRSLLLIGLLFFGASTASAQAPSLWRDPVEGCWYVISPQGSVAVRYRRDGTPDCPDAKSVSGPEAPAIQPVPAAVAPALSVVAPRQPSALPNPPPPGRTVNPVRTAVVSFACVGIDASAPPVQRVRIDPSAMLLTVEAMEAGGIRTESYSIDTNMDVWLGGRNRRDPRLGFVLTQSRGQLRLDWPSGGGLRAPFRSYEFRCRPMAT